MGTTMGLQLAVALKPCATLLNLRAVVLQFRTSGRASTMATVPTGDIGAVAWSSISSCTIVVARCATKVFFLRSCQFLGHQRMMWKVQEQLEQLEELHCYVPPLRGTVE
ncbi:hypothetical protein ACH5RR_040877 [Cinchona calisaya]|uniref:Secreted protein n=1 Tax=Cinchona calisaya TaxID=153742 RepID=A0ABD2XXB8_9GENT